MKKVIFKNIISHYADIATQVLPYNFLTALPKESAKEFKQNIQRVRICNKKNNSNKGKIMLVLNKNDLQTMIKFYQQKAETRRINQELRKKLISYCQRFLNDFDTYPKDYYFYSKGEDLEK